MDEAIRAAFTAGVPSQITLTRGLFYALSFPSAFGTGVPWMHPDRFGSIGHQTQLSGCKASFHHSDFRTTWLEGPTPGGSHDHGWGHNSTSYGCLGSQDTSKHSAGSALTSKARSLAGARGSWSPERGFEQEVFELGQSRGIHKRRTKVGDGLAKRVRWPVIEGLLPVRPEHF